MIEFKKAHKIARKYIDNLNQEGRAYLKSHEGMSFSKHWYLFLSRPWWYLRQQFAIIFDIAVITDIQEKDFGWVFYYESRLFTLTRWRGYHMVGNAPLIVDRDDGQLHITGTAYHTDYYINEYRKARSKSFT